MQTIKTKIFTCLLSFVMVFSMLPALNSNAASNSGKCGDKVSWKLDSNGTLTITGNGPMYDFVYDTTTNIPWYSNRTSIRKIVINNGVERIGNFAFVWCTNLKTVVWPTNGSLKSIGKCAFAKDNLLESITLPNGLVSVGYEAFMDCSGATELVLPNTLKVIAYGAFANCTHVTKVYLPASVTTIGDFSFRGMFNLVRFTGGAGLVTIGAQAFEHDSKLSYFVITSKKLKKIGKGCFNCDFKLKTIYIKNTTKLTKKGVKGSLYLSSVKKVKVKKSKVKKYKKYFTYRNCGKRSVKVRK